jgi:hypothetical protein
MTVGGRYRNSPLMITILSEVKLKFCEVFSSKCADSFLGFARQQRSGWPKIMHEITITWSVDLARGLLFRIDHNVTESGFVSVFGCLGGDAAATAALSAQAIAPYSWTNLCT